MANTFRYYEIKPAEILNNYIKEYWIIDDVKDNCSIEVFPYGCFDIVVYINKNTNNTILITGIWSKKISVDIYKDIDVIGVRFRPNSVDLLFDINVNELQNIKQSFSEDMLKKSDEIDLSILYDSKKPDEIINFYNFYFKYILAGAKFNSIFDYISSLSENYTVNEFAKVIGISERQLLREYRNKLGITTKDYISILRFIKAKNMLVHGMNLNDIVFACGYSDESHLIRDFKKHTSYTPKEFLNHV